MLDNLIDSMSRQGTAEFPSLMCRRLQHGFTEAAFFAFQEFALFFSADEGQR